MSIFGPVHHFGQNLAVSAEILPKLRIGGSSANADSRVRRAPEGTVGYVAFSL
jgi:hypothetical protein